MNSFGRRFGQGSFGRWGSGHRIESLPEDGVLLWKDFSGGFNASVKDKGQPSASPDCLDVEVTSRGGLRPVPGVAEHQVLLPRVPDRMLIHASIDNSAEILLFDPPWLGIIGTSPLAWVNVGFDESPGANWTNFGGSFIFSDGRRKVYVRQSQALTVEELDAPVADAYATFAGRVFACGCEIDGQWEPLGIKWSAANSDYTDWTSFGSGAELLINDMLSGDRFIAALPMGFDFMALAFRESLWVGRFTGLAERPVDFQPRVKGLGLVSGKTAQVTELGLVGLSDDGVIAFDGNEAQVISQAIDPELLPLDYEQLNKYSSAYDAQRGLYFLFTPTETWVLEVRKGRWQRRSLAALDAVRYAPQETPLHWNSPAIAGLTWAQLTQTWREMSPAESDESSLYLLIETELETIVGVEDESLSTNIGIPLESYWQLSGSTGNLMERLVRFKDVLVDYLGEGIVDILMLDDQSAYQPIVRLVLPYQEFGDYVRSDMVESGRGAALRVRWEEGRPEISEIELRVAPRGRRLNNVV
jgi:hypothetical protein